VSVPLALIGATALYLLFAWLASAILASYLSSRKGYGEDSRWKRQGPLPRRRVP
jgi:hypothetical protein